MIRIGSILHGYCGGYFGRDSYNCKRVEAIGADWLVVREVHEGTVDTATGFDILENLEEFLQVEYNQCTCKGD